MNDLSKYARVGSDLANKVLDEGSQVQSDDKWLKAHKNDANIKDELATKAPDIQKDWENFQGDEASLQKTGLYSDDSTLRAGLPDRSIALMANASVCADWQSVGADIHDILKPMTASIQSGDSTSTGIFKNFVSTIDQGNACLLHLQQQVKEDPSSVDITPIDQAGINRNNLPGPVVGGTVSADAINAQKQNIIATSKPAYTVVDYSHLPPGSDKP